jgi:hypothetical protein
MAKKMQEHAMGFMPSNSVLSDVGSYDKGVFDVC